MKTTAPQPSSHGRPSSTVADRVFVALAAISLTAYLAFSLSVRAFASELIRLASKLLG